MQYTLRNVPRNVDKAVRARMKAERKSLNQAVIDALKVGLGVSDEPRKKRDLSDLVGTLSAEDARAIEEARKWFDQVEEDAWR